MGFFSQAVGRKLVWPHQSGLRFLHWLPMCFRIDFKLFLNFLKSSMGLLFVLDYRLRRRWPEAQSVSQDGHFLASCPVRLKHRLILQPRLNQECKFNLLSVTISSLCAEDHFLERELDLHAGSPLESLESPPSTRASDGRFLSQVTHHTVRESESAQLNIISGESYMTLIMTGLLGEYSAGVLLACNVLWLQQMSLLLLQVLSLLIHPLWVGGPSVIIEDYY